MDTKLHLMIVEDNIHARKALMALLTLEKDIHFTMAASNGLEAVNSINEQVPDLVLMDLRMPVMGGLEATRIIKQNWPRVKIIILTIYSENRVDALSAGADAFLVKGCPKEMMMSSIRNLFHPEM